MLTYQEALQKLIVLNATPEDDLLAHFKAVLALGCEYLALEVGIISKIVGDRYSIVASHSPTLPLAPGLRFTWSRTFCERTFRADEPVSVIHCAEDPHWCAHPAYLDTRLEAYIGVRFKVDGEPWGTINFSSLDPYSREFVPEDYIFLELLRHSIETTYAQHFAKQEQLRYFELSLDPILDLDLSGRILRGNKACNTLFGEAAALVGQDFLSLAVPEDRNRLERAMQRAYQGLTSAQVEVRSSRRDSLWLSFSFIPVLERGLVVAVGRDVSPLKLIHEQLVSSHKDAIAARDEALDANEAKGRFFASTSHELRTPLNGIIGMSELLMETPLKPKQLEYVRMLAQSAQSLLVIINDILDLSKIEARTYSLTPSVVRVRELVASVARMLTPSAQRKGLELGVFVDPANPRFVEVDPGRLKQLLINLTDNALKFTPSGEVVIRALAPQLLEDGACLMRFEVEDTGPGMSPEVASRIFEPFYRGGSEAPGTGLGLAICASLIKVMGGQIAVKSALGQGAKFEFSVMAKLETHEHEPKTSNLFVVEPKALFVGDGRAAKSLSPQLAQWGVQLHRCLPYAHDIIAQADEATRQLRPFHLLIFDQSLPDAEALMRWSAAEPRFDRAAKLWVEQLGVAGLESSSLSVATETISLPVERERLLESILSALEKCNAVTPSLLEDSELLLVPATAFEQERSALLLSKSKPMQLSIAKKLNAFSFPLELVETLDEARRVLASRCYPLVFLDLEVEGAHHVLKWVEDAPLTTLIAIGSCPKLMVTRAECISVREFELKWERMIRDALDGAGVLAPEQLAQTAVNDMHILVVDDQVINQRVVAGYLERAGCKVTLARDGGEAVELYKSSCFDAIFMDCQMPVMDGFEAAEQIRKIERGSHDSYTPIIALTAYTGVRHRALDAGMDDVLHKPILRQSLLETLEHWLQRPGSPAGRHAMFHQSSSSVDDDSVAEVALYDDALPVLDHAVLIKLVRDCQDVGFVFELVQDFIEESVARCAQIVDESSSAEELAKIAHTVKGSGSIFGLVRLSQCAKSFHDQWRAGEVAALRAQARALSNLYKESLEVLALEAEAFKPSADGLL